MNQYSRAAYDLTGENQFSCQYPVSVVFILSWLSNCKKQVSYVYLYSSVRYYRAGPANMNFIGGQFYWTQKLTTLMLHRPTILTGLRRAYSVFRSLFEWYSCCWYLTATWLNGCRDRKSIKLLYRCPVKLVADTQQFSHSVSAVCKCIRLKPSGQSGEKVFHCLFVYRGFPLDWLLGLVESQLGLKRWRRSTLHAASELAEVSGSIFWVYCFHWEYMDSLRLSKAGRHI